MPMEFGRVRTLLLGSIVGFSVVFADARADGLSPRQVEEISDLASGAIVSSRLPGLVIAVSKNEVVWTAGFGHADLEQNVLIRQYIPKGESMTKPDQYQCNAIARQLNRRPRKRLGYRTPEECFYAS
jgi:hypothetical protein